MLVGRESEIALLVGRLDEGRPVAVLGEAGVGKTTLVRSAAAQRGKPLVEAGALATLSWLPYLPLRRAFGHEFDGDAAYVGVAVEVELGDSVLLMDDLQWADAQTASLLPLLAERVPLVAVLRRGDPGTAKALEWATAAGLELLPLEPLSDADAAGLARSLHPGLSDLATQRLVERSGGNPFLLEQLGATGETSDSLRLTVAARVRALTPEGRDAIAALALIGRPAAPGLLGAGAAEIVDAGLATANGDVAIRHALLAEATIETLTDEVRRRIHSRVAADLDDLGEAARHHAAAGERALAHEKALLAAERATTPGERVAHLGVAAANVDGARGEPLRAAAARELIAIGEPADALALVEALRPAAADLAAEVALLRSQAHLELIHVDDARRELAAAADAGTTDVRLRVRIATQQASLAARDGDYRAALAAAEDGARIADSAGADGREIAELYARLGSVRRYAGEPRAREAQERALAAARRAGSSELEFAVLSSLTFGLLLEGEAAVADKLVLEAVERARSLRLLAWERGFLASHAGFAWHLGDPATAAAEAEAVLAEAIAPADREFLEFYWWQAMNDLGRGEAVCSDVEARVANAPADNDGVGDALWALADIHLAAGRPDAAEHAAASYLERFGRASTFVGVVRAWAQFEQGVVPTEVYGTQFALVEAGPIEVDALVALFSDDAVGAASLFDRAAEIWDGRHDRGAARCRWAAAESLRRSGQPDEAQRRLLLIEADVEQRQLNVLLRKIRRSLRLTGVHRAVERTTVGDLTGREVEVLELVAKGLTNQEIARRLGLGRPTVIRLIGSAQQKLGAKNRTQAAALAARL